MVHRIKIISQTHNTLHPWQPMSVPVKFLYEQSLSITQQKNSEIQSFVFTSSAHPFHLHPWINVVFISKGIWDRQKQQKAVLLQSKAR